MSYIDEQINWWRAEGFTPWDAYQALYGKSPWVMSWWRLACHMERDFGSDVIEMSDAQAEVLADRIEAELNNLPVSMTGRYVERQRAHV